jgi:3'-5' exoribonuclease
MSEKKKTVFISDIVAGMAVSDIFVLADKNMAHKRDGNPFLTITLADKTGRIKAVVWDNVEQIAAAANPGDFVRVGAAAGEFRGVMQLVVKSLAALEPESIHPEEFIAGSARNVNQMFERLSGLTDSIRPGPLKDLMAAFWSDADFVDLFKRAPAAKMMHHAYLGGLLEHTLSMALLADKISSHYSRVDRDLLLAGVILHDVGKIRELSYNHHIDYTDEGRLVGHIGIGLGIVESKIRTLDGFPSELSALIKHMIVSHHGAREFGSPEPPKTIEAVLLNYIDEIDSRINAIREHMDAEDSNARWTSYHRLLERHFYLGDPPTTGA